MSAKDHINIVYDNSTVTIQTEPKVLYENFIVFTDWTGAVIGTIDATFDFTNMPPAQHPFGLQILQGQAQHVHTGDIYTYRPPGGGLTVVTDDGDLSPAESSTEAKDAPEIRSWWRRLFGRRRDS